MIAKFDQKGSILIGIIAAMVLFAALGAAILSLTSTATMNQVMANSAARAYYLAESGLRYAYNPGDSSATIESTLEGLHGETFTLNNNDGRFELEVYPYYLEVYANPQGHTTLQAEFRGGFEDLGIEHDITQKVQIGATVYSYSGKIQPFSSNQLLFDGFPDNPLLPYIPVGTDVFFMALATGQTVAAGEDILLKTDTGIQFPLRNGIIEIDGHICSYREHADNKLKGIKIHDDPPNSFDIPDDQEIVLQKFVKIESTGTFGEGNLQPDRKVVYYVPFPIRDRGKEVEFHETFDGSSSPWESVSGSHEVKEVGGDNALKVTASGSLTVFKWLETVIDLKSSHKQAGNYLSYDAQVKIGFVSGVPDTYMAGISFRIAGEGANPDSYGISFVKSEGDDGIPDDLVPPVPPAIMPAIVLWQKTDAGRTWLAYKSLPISFEPADATILVRIIEAVSIEFTGGGPDPVKAGDRVIGRTSGAKGKVVGYPILDDGGDDWAGNNAAGRILLNNVTGIFTSGEIVNIVGSETTVTVDVYNSDKANYIRAYYSTEAFIQRATIEWPPDSANFILVEWEGEPLGVNPTVSPPVEQLDSNTIIRSASLVTTDPFSTNIPELGLHTFGVNSTSIYFDDFAMQAVIEADPIILPPVQE